MNEVIGDLNPLVSVVVPCYNVAGFVAQCLDSVLTQSYRNIEVIAVNDGSTDGTPDILRLNRDSITIIDQVNMGLAAARNTGGNAANGAYLIFLDADDLLLPNAIDTLVRSIVSNPQVDIVYGEALPIDHSGSLLSHHPMGFHEPGKNPSKQLCQGTLFQMGLALIRRDVFLRVKGFDGALRRCEDLDFQFRVSDFASIQKIKDVVLFYRINTQGLTRNYTEQYRVASSVLRRHVFRRKLIFRYPVQVLIGFFKMNFYMVSEHRNSLKANASEVSTFALSIKHPLFLPIMLVYPLLVRAKSVIKKRRLER